MVLRNSLRYGCGLAAALIVAAQPAAARGIATTTITIDVGGQTMGATCLPRRGGVTPDVLALRSARQITDGAFTRLDLRVILTEDDFSTDEVTGDPIDPVYKMVDQGFRDEPSGCAPGSYGPLDMEDGLRYFFEIPVATADGGQGERVSGTIYPGNRSTHLLNDVFCEYDEARGASAAILRFTGYYYVIHRQLPDQVDIQLRPLTLTEEELSKLPWSNEDEILEPGQAGYDGVGSLDCSARPGLDPAPQ